MKRIGERVELNKSEGILKSSHENSEMKVTIWGARGSFPSPLVPGVVQERIRSNIKRFVQQAHGDLKNETDFFSKLARHHSGGYGGNTPCLEVSAGSNSVIIDGGSGIRPLGYELLKGPCGQGQGEVHIIFTHFHWDHIIGLLFFTPIFIPGNRIHVYAVQPELEQVFRMLFQKPFFPVPLEKLGSRIEYHRLEPRVPFELGGMQITPYQLDHPDPCWGFKFEKNGRAFSHCVDTECTRFTPAELGPDLPLYRGLDLMIFDAQYTLVETIEKVDWGHATASLGIDMAMREGTKRVVFMHHDPASSDEKIAAAESQAQRYYQHQLARADLAEGKVSEVQWAFGYDGMVLEV